jgi:hypothetical protein
VHIALAQPGLALAVELDGGQDAELGDARRRAISAFARLVDALRNG